MRIRRAGRIQHLGHVTSAMLILLLPSSIRAQTDAPQRAAAEVLFREAQKLVARHEYEGACPRLEEVVKLLPKKVGARMALAACYEAQGKLASAWATLLECESIARGLHDPRERQVHDDAARLAPRLTKLSIVVSASAPPDLSIQRDDVPIGRGQWGQALPMDRGAYRIRASLPGRRSFDISVDVTGEGQTITIEIPELEPEHAIAPPPPVEPPSPRSAVEPAPPGDREPRKEPAPKLSHSGQFGVFVRTDIDGKFRGLVAVPGLSFGLGDHVEIEAAGLLGKNKGFWAGASGYVLKGIIKPMVTLGTHVFIVDGARAGLHGAAGLQIDPLRHLGFFATAGISYFPIPPTGYEQVNFLPSLGVQGRL